MFILEVIQSLDEKQIKPVARYLVPSRPSTSFLPGFMWIQLSSLQLTVSCMLDIEWGPGDEQQLRCGPCSLEPCSTD